MPGMDKLKALESFVSVATRGSLTAAAQAEGVAPAIMGRRLDALEERLGVKLLVRTTRRITLTHEGSAFLEDCQRLLADLANAEASVSAGGVKASGHLRITAPAGFGRRHVAPLVPLFIAQHPDVNVSLNLSDRVRLTTEHFMVLPSIVQATDLAVVMPRSIALDFAGAEGAAIIEPPVAPELRELAVSLHWSRRFESDPGNRWLRDTVVDTFKT